MDERWKPYVPRIQNGYEIKINEEVFRISLTK